MLLIQLLVSFACVFMSGMNYAAWDMTGVRKNLYISIFIGLVGFFNLASLIGLTIRVTS